MWWVWLIGCTVGLDDPVDPPTDTGVGVRVTGDTFELPAVPTGDTFDLPDEVVIPPIDCHLFHPVEWSDWTRTYDVTIDEVSGTEVHAPQGYEATPSGAAVGEAWKVTEEITGAGSSNGTVTRWMRCDLGETGLYEVAWRRAGGGATVTAVADDPKPVLPDASHMDATPPAVADHLSENNRFSVSKGIYTLTLRQNVDSVLYHGIEEVTVPAGTFDAFHMTSIYTEWTANAQSGDPILALLQQLLGASVSTTAEEKQVDAWYVEGLGMIKEKVLLSTGETVSTRELRSCSGLPWCPDEQ